MLYLSLFFVAFLSGSLLPMGSEALVIYDLKEGYNPILVIFFASAGNTLGAVLNYYMGLKGEEFLENKGYLNGKRLSKAKERFKKYGAFALLLSPLPIIGDPITFVAGILRYNFKKFLLIVAIAKSIRYASLLIFL